MISAGKSLLLLIALFVLHFSGFAQLSLGFNSNGNTAGCAPYTLTFPITNVGANPANTSYTINFGDGSPVLNFTQANIPASVTHTYTTNSCGASFQSTSNVFGATITATSPSSSPFTAAVSPIVISSPPDAAISPATSTVCVGSSVTFQNNSSEGIYIDPSAGYACVTNGAIHYWTVSPATGWSASAANMGSNNGFPDAADLDVWTEGASSLNVQFSQPGNYRVKMWIANICSLDTLSVPVCVIPVPNPQFSLNPTFGCILPNLNATATNTTTVPPGACAPVAYTYNWTVSPGSGWNFNGASTASSVSPSFTFSQNATYTVTLNATASSFSGCSASVSHPITVNLAPIVAAGSDQSVCVGSPPVQLSGSPAGGSWSGPGVNAAGLFTPSATGNFTLTYSFTPAAGTGCPPQTDQVIVSVITPTPAEAGLPQSFCPGSPSVQLNGTPSGGSWSGTGVSSSGIFTPSTPGNFTLTYSFGTGPCAVSDQVVMTVYTPPSVNVNDPVICQGATATLTAVGSAGLGPYTFGWSPGAGLSATSGASVTCTPPLSTSYVVTVTDAHFCTATNTADITVNPVPTVDAGLPQSLCNTPQVTQLSGTPVGGIWSGPGVTGTGAFTPPGLGNFTLTYSYTSPANCPATDQVVISVINPSAANAGSNRSACAGGAAVQLNGLPAGGTWSGTGVNSTGTFTPTSAGTFTLTYNFGSGTCAASDQLDVIVNPSPTVMATDGASCDGSPATLTASAAGGSGGYVFVWSPAASLNTTAGDTVIATVSSTSVFSVTVSDANNCTATDNATVTIAPVPTADAGPDQTICLNPAIIQMNGIPGGGVWSGDNVTATGQYTATAAGTDSLFYTQTLGTCVRSDTMLVIVQVPAPLVLTPDTSVCLNSGTFQLYAATSGGTWTSPTGNITPGGIFTPDAVGIFNLSYTAGTGFCAVGGSLQVEVLAPPTVDAGQNVSLCSNSAPFTFPGESPSSNGTFSWSGNGISNATAGIFDPTVSGEGNFTVTYTYTSTTTGCSASDNLEVIVHPLPQIQLSTNTLGVCLTPAGSELTATPTGGFWTGSGLSFGSDVSAPPDTAVFTPSAAGTVIAFYTFTDINSCVSRDTVTITVSVPAPSNAGNDTAFCFTNSQLQLQGSPVGGTWVSPSWISGAGVFTGTTTGTYNAVYAVGGGTCLVYDTTEVTIHPLPIVTAGADQTLCVDVPCMNLAAPSPLGGTWAGSGITDAVTGQFCTASASGGANEIIYTYQNPSTTCVNKDTLQVTVVPMPVPGLSINPLFCINTQVQAVNSSSGPASSFEWNVRNIATGALVMTTDNTAPIVMVTTAGNYSLEQICRSPENCETRDTVYFTAVAPPNAAFQLADNVVCGPHQETVTNSSSGYQISFAWNFGPAYPTATDTIPILPVFAAPVLADSLYHVTLTVTNVCGVRTAVDSVVLRPVPIALIGTDYSQGCTPFSAVYQNVSYGSPDWFQWDLGDGTTSTDSLPPPHTYATNDTVSTITISLSIGNTCGNATSSATIVVYPDQINPQAQTPLTGCAPLEASFSFSLGDLSYYLWDFGDSTGIAGDSVSHVYENPGVYDVQLTVSNFCLVDTITNTVTVLAGPDLAFVIDQPSVCQSNDVVITNISGLGSNYVIDFGDGQSSPLPLSVSHSYTSTGLQTLSFSGQNPQTGCPDTITQTLSVLPYPVINVSADPDTGCMPLQVNFFNSSLGATGYEWHFSDGTSSILPEPQLLLPNAGDYNVQLIAHNFQGISFDCADTLELSIHVNPSPHSAFILSADSACGPPAAATVTNTSTGGTSFTWLWEMNTSTDFAPQLAFADTGAHLIQLVAANDFACTDTSGSRFYVLGNPRLALSIDPPDGCAPHEVLFTNLSQYGDSVRWAFGDGEFSTLDAASHTYMEAGLYSVELYVTSGGLCSADSVLVEVIEVYPTAEASLNVSPSIISESSPHIDLVNSSQFSDAYEFFIGDDFMGNEVPTDYLFSSPDTGLIQLKLIANNQYNCPDTTSADLYIKSAPNIYIPSAFTPNEDGLNDGFRPYLDRSPTYYYFAVYDRWGHPVFETMDKEVFWNGSFMNKGKKAIKQDVYVYKLRVIFDDDQIYNLFGNIAIVH